MWGAILAEREPPRGRHLWTGMWHYARGMAYAHTGRLTPARAELAALERMTEDPTTRNTLVNFTNAGTLLAIARETLAGELRLRSGETDLALAHLERAQRLEVVYWQDLTRNRENGFALHGLTLALEAQGRSEGASGIRKRFEKAWAAADVTLPSSAFGDVEIR
jgi:hypothetical protein